MPQEEAPNRKRACLPTRRFRFRDDDALDLLKTRGCDVLANFHPTDVATRPGSASLAAALPYRVASWETVGRDALTVKTILAQGRPLVAVISVRPDFDALSPRNPVYDSVAGASRGLNAICIVGYDDARGAVEIVNQWGTGWGLDGYGWISYGLVAGGTDVLELYDVQDTIPATVSIAATAASASEAPGHIGRFTVTRVGDTSAPLTVALAISGTATNGRDYQPIPLAVRIPAGCATTAIAVEPIEDRIAEPRETVALRIAAGGYGIGSPASATVSIDDDETPLVTVAAAAVVSRDAGTGAVFTVRRLGSTTAALSEPVAWSGAAVGTGLTLPTAFRLRAGAASASLTVMPVGGVGALVATIAGDAGFAVGSPASASAELAGRSAAP